MPHTAAFERAERSALTMIGLVESSSHWAAWHVRPPVRVLSLSALDVRDDAPMEELTGERREWIETDPNGVQYNVIVAPRGTRLRGTTMSYDFEDIVIETVAATVAALVPRGRMFKLGVLTPDGAGWRWVHKEKLDTESDALERALQVRERIRRGDLDRGTSTP